jgi:lipoprotein-anchoring transpeptidase ErfK/SrfK
MHRDARRFLISFAAVLVTIAMAGAGLRWIFSSSPTELTGKTSDTATALKPVPAAAPPPSKAPPVAKPAAPEKDIPAARPEAARPSGSATIQVPTTQPMKTLQASPGTGRKEMETGFAARERKELVTARTHLNNALHSGLPQADETRVRKALAELAQETIFCKRLVQNNDPLVKRHTVRIGDSLARIAKQYRISEDFLASINGLTNKNIVRLNSTMKVVEGPFNVSVIKRDHELHVYLQDLYVQTFKVALGMGGTTPTGTWKVVNHLENPSWIDPDGKQWHPNDPNNPIGEFWIGLEGIEGEAVGKAGFGIHGTIEPKTIGQDVSLGCVRLAPDDIAAVYRLLVPGVSIATISEK